MMMLLDVVLCCYITVLTLSLYGTIERDQAISTIDFLTNSKLGQTTVSSSPLSLIAPIVHTRI